MLRTLIFLTLAALVLACQDDWSNKCTKNGDCCSKDCNKQQSDWKYGICRPAEAQVDLPSGGCLSDGSNQCANNKHCCSKFCDKPKDWRLGICKPKKGNSL